MEHRLRIGTRIRELRTSKGYSQRQLEQLCGVTAQNIQKIEAGRYSVGLDVLSRICTALGAKVEIITE